MKCSAHERRNSFCCLFRQLWRQNTLLLHRQMPVQARCMSAHHCRLCQILKNPRIWMPHSVQLLLKLNLQNPGFRSLHTGAYAEQQPELYRHFLYRLWFRRHMSPLQGRTKNDPQSLLCKKPSSKMSLQTACCTIHCRENSSIALRKEGLFYHCEALSDLTDHSHPRHCRWHRKK